MKNLIFIFIISFTLYGCEEEKTEAAADEAIVSENEMSASDLILLSAFQNKQSDLQVQGEGTVSHLLPDDNKGSRHQRFILELSTKQTVLVAHNIDLAPRIDSLKKGDTIEFYGEYEWNVKGGVIHWTHNAPNGNHEHGWLKHDGITYQ